MTSIPTPDEFIYFKCPYCDLEYDLWKLIGCNDITQRTSVFECSYWDKGRLKKSGCGKRFVIDLKFTYEIAITELKEEQKSND